MARLVAGINPKSTPPRDGGVEIQSDDRQTAVP